MRPAFVTSQRKLDSSDDRTRDCECRVPSPGTREIVRSSGEEFRGRHGGP